MEKLSGRAQKAEGQAECGRDDSAIGQRLKVVCVPSSRSRSSYSTTGQISTGNGVTDRDGVGGALAQVLAVQRQCIFAAGRRCKGAVNDGESFEPLIEGLELPDKDDRHVLAAAIKCSAQVIVTENLRDFPNDILEQYGVEALNADDMLANTYDLYPIECARALRVVRRRYDNPHFTPSEFLLDLTKCGMPKLAAMARASIEYL